MCKGVNTYPRPLVYEVAAQSVPGPSILYLNWAGIIASREEVLAARLLVDTFGLRLHTLRCHMRNARFCCCGAKIVKTRLTQRDSSHPLGLVLFDSDTNYWTLLFLCVCIS